jgi:23S rRNA pseudouridine1911/1915/1917 synthase
VHLSHKGFPLVGDFEYGGDTVVFGPNDFNYLQKMDAILQQCNGQMLWACKLSFSHPNSRNRMDFKLQTPREFQSIMHQIKAMEADRDGL